MAILTIDIGTTGSKAVLFGESGEVIALAYQEYPLLYPKPGWAEVDVETLWSTVRKNVREIAGQHRKDIQVLCLSCMGQNIVPVRQDGTAIRNGILAFDTRTTEELKIIRDTIGEMAYFKIRGNRPSYICGENKILWLKSNEPDTFRQTWKFMTFGDYIRTRLGFPGIIDISMAASGLPFDIRKRDYSDIILEELGLDRKMFSEVVASDQLLGEIGFEVRTELGLPKGVKVVTGGHDTMCGILGAGVTQHTPHVIANINGTWESIGYIRSNPILTKQAMDNEVSSSCSVLKDTFVVIQALATSGSIVRWFRDELAYEERMIAAQEKTNVYDNMFAPLNFDGGTTLAIPFFSGNSHDSYAKGAFLGLTLGTTRCQLLQSAVEGVTHEMTVMLERLETLSSSSIDVIRAFGGPAKSTKWLQLKADISGKKVEALQVEESSALGAALLAGVAIGVYNSYEEGIKAAIKIKATYHPRSEIHQIYVRQHKIYKQLIEVLKPFNEIIYNM
jgi:xylulokinase